MMALKLCVSYSIHKHSNISTSLDSTKARSENKYIL